jgi:methionyl-tRNA formyltransferase/ADP-ribose pyrophosphatase YjhB (NUDIX family)
MDLKVLTANDERDMKIVLLSSHEYGLAVASSVAMSDGDNDWSLVKISERVGRNLLGPRYRSMSAVRGAFGSVVEVEDPSNLNSEAIALASDSECVLVIGWPRLLKSEVLEELAAFDAVAIGFHPSPLPIGRGMSPIAHTIIDQLSSSAVTAFILEATIDSGPIVARMSFSIEKHDHAEQIYAKAIISHVNCVSLVIRSLMDGALQQQPQLGEVKAWERIRNSDRVLDTSNVSEIGKLVRAHNFPYPRMTLEHTGRTFYVSGVNHQGVQYGYPADGNQLDIDLLNNGEVILSVYEQEDCDCAQRKGYIMSRDLSKEVPNGDFHRRYSGTVLVRDGLVLLQERDNKPGIINPGGITLFGGAVEESEGFAEAAARELSEELEIEIEPNALSELGYVSKIEPDMSVTLCSMFALNIDDATELVQHEGQGIYVATVHAALTNPKVSETCKTTLRALQNMKGLSLD